MGVLEFGADGLSQSERRRQHGVRAVVTQHQPPLRTPGLGALGLKRGGGGR